MFSGRHTCNTWWGDRRAEYDYGAAFEVYSMVAPAWLDGVRFSDAAGTHDGTNYPRMPDTYAVTHFCGSCPPLRSYGRRRRRRRSAHPFGIRRVADRGKVRRHRCARGWSRAFQARFRAPECGHGAAFTVPPAGALNSWRKRHGSVAACCALTHYRGLTSRTSRAVERRMAAAAARRQLRRVRT